MKRKKKKGYGLLNFNNYPKLNLLKSTDWDKDLVPASLDCQPYNRRKQGGISAAATSAGFYKSNIPVNSYVELGRTLGVDVRGGGGGGVAPQSPEQVAIQEAARKAAEAKAAEDKRLAEEAARKAAEQRAAEQQERKEAIAAGKISGQQAYQERAIAAEKAAYEKAGLAAPTLQQNQSFYGTRTNLNQTESAYYSMVKSGEINLPEAKTLPIRATTTAKENQSTSLSSSSFPSGAVVSAYKEKTFFQKVKQAVTSGLPFGNKIDQIGGIFIAETKQITKEKEEREVRRIEQGADILNLGKQEQFGGKNFFDLNPIQQSGTAEITKVTPYTDIEIAKSSQPGSRLVLTQRTQRELAGEYAVSSLGISGEVYGAAQKEANILGTTLQESVNRGMDIGQAQEEYKLGVSKIESAAQKKYEQRMQEVWTPKQEEIESRYNKLSRTATIYETAGRFAENLPVLALVGAGSLLIPPTATSSLMIASGVAGAVSILKNPESYNEIIDIKRDTSGKVLGYGISSKMTSSATLGFSLAGASILGGAWGLSSTAAKAVDIAKLEALQSEEASLAGKVIYKKGKDVGLDIYAFKGYEFKGEKLIPTGDVQQLSKVRYAVSQTGDDLFSVPIAKGTTKTKYWSFAKQKYITTSEPISATAKGQITENLNLIMKRGGVETSVGIEGYPAGYGSGILNKGNQIESFKFLGTAKPTNVAGVTEIRAFQPEKFRVYKDNLGVFEKTSVLSGKQTGKGLMFDFDLLAEKEGKIIINLGGKAVKGKPGITGGVASLSDEVTLYHGTTKEAAEKILKEGFKGELWATPEEARALGYAGRAVIKEGGKETAILKFQVSKSSILGIDKAMGIKLGGIPVERISLTGQAVKQTSTSGSQALLQIQKKVQTSKALIGGLTSELQRRTTPVLQETSTMLVVTPRVGREQSLISPVVITNTNEKVGSLLFQPLSSISTESGRQRLKNSEVIKPVTRLKQEQAQIQPSIQRTKLKQKTLQKQKLATQIVNLPLKPIMPRGKFGGIGFILPKLPSGGRRGVRRKGQRGKQQTGYQPSFTGSALNIKTPTIPKFGGSLQVRGIVTGSVSRKRKSKLRRRSYNRKIKRRKNRR